MITCIFTFYFSFVVHKDQYKFLCSKATLWIRYISQSVTKVTKAQSHFISLKWMTFLDFYNFFRIFHKPIDELEARISPDVQEDLRHPVREKLGRVHRFLQGAWELLWEWKRGFGGGTEKIFHPFVSEDVYCAKLSIYFW